MGVCVAGLEVFDAWLDENPVRDGLGRAVLAAIVGMQDNYEALFKMQAPLGARPLVREVDVPEAGVTIVVYLQRPNRGILLLSINAWS